MLLMNSFEDQAIQGVLYTETRYNPHFLTGDSLTSEQVRMSYLGERKFVYE